MLSTIEKVILLKDVDLFSEMPDELLAEVASLLTEVELAAGQMVFAKGDNGDSLYVIVDGEVRVFDGAHTINHLGEGEVFGEMALLDTEPRMASVVAVSDTLMLRLEQEPFFDLMETRSEVARGVIRVLSARLRGRVAEVTELRSRERLGVG
jgi:CRP-like cAMP-binding protein